MTDSANTAALHPAPVHDAPGHDAPVHDWDACAEIGAQGTWLLEASAGTGKTWQLASLVARLVVETETRIDRILVITFTRAATAELRTRVRDRLVEVRAGLRRHRDTGVHPVERDATGAPKHPVLDRLCGCDDPELEHRLRRVEAAIATFDLAPISTIHGFSQRMLDALAFESGQDVGLTLLEELGPIRDQLVADAVATVHANATAAELDDWIEAGWTPDNLKAVVQAACSVSGGRIEPDPGPEPGVTSPGLKQAIEAFGGWWEESGRRLAELLTADAKARPEEHEKAADQYTLLVAAIERWLSGAGGATRALEAARAFTPDGITGAVKETRAVRPIAFVYADSEQGDRLIDAMGKGDPAPPLRDWWERRGRALAEELVRDASSRPAEYQRGWQPVKIRAMASTIEKWMSAGKAPATAQKNLAKLHSAKIATAVRKTLRVPCKPFVDDEGLADGAEELVAAVEAEREAINPLAAFARRAREQVEKALLERRELTFDAMLTRLAEAVKRETEAAGRGEAGAAGRPLARAIAAQFDAVFVDEFQDTDAAQWRVVHDVFAGCPGRRLFLVGDPKQAIYAFRGADVFVYLAAKAATPAPAAPDPAGGRYTMKTNWRSDGALVHAMNALWGTAPRAFGDLDIDYVRVGHAPDREGWSLGALDAVPRVVGDPDLRRPLELRWLQGEPDPENDGLPRRISTTEARGAVARSCALEIATMLRKGVRLGRRESGDRERGRPVRPGDFAVLVNTHREAAEVAAALRDHGVMAVRAGTGNVFASPVARWLLDLLAAVANPGWEATARALVVNPLFGRTLAELADALRRADDGSPAAGAEPASSRLPKRERPLDWAAWRQEIRGWAERWGRHRFIGVVQGVLADYDVVEHLLGCEEGERLATDLRHLIELGHRAERERHLGPEALATWILEQQATVKENADNAPRLESDAAAVQIVTVHKAKGLQYPIAMVPFAWSPMKDPDKRVPIVVHRAARDADETSCAAAITDLHHPETEARKQAVAQHRLEREQERVRRLYVAMTRAEHHCVVWAVTPDAVGAKKVDGRLVEKAHRATVNAILLRARGDGRESHEALAEDFQDLWRKPGTSRKTGNSMLLDALTRRDERLAALVATSGETIGWRIVRDPGEPAGRAAPARQAAPESREPALATFDRREKFASAWQRASFSAMPKGRDFDDEELRDAMVRVEREERLRGGIGDTDDRADDGPGAGGEGGEGAGEASAEAPTLPLGAMWGGTSVGTWVHGVLEHLDFRHPAGERPAPAHFAAWRLSDPKLRAEAVRRCPLRALPQPGADPQAASDLIAARGERHGHRRKSDHERLLLALPHILHAPLSDPRMGEYALPEGFCLARLGREDRIDELGFDMSLMGGELWRSAADGRPGPLVPRDEVIEALGHRLAKADGAAGEWDGRGWLEALLNRGVESETKRRGWDDSPADERKGKRPSLFSPLPRIAGMLTGFIDLTFRVRKGERDLYYIADYKTNRIRSPGARRAGPGNYVREGLAWSMGHANYHLQGLIYTLALHRFLRERLPDYDYNKHVGGHLYLYLRGMAADDRGRYDGSLRGVYADRWPARTMLALDEALDPTLAARRGEAA